MRFNGLSDGRLDTAFSRRRFLKSSVASGTLATGLATGLSACSPPWEHQFSPQVPNWLQQLAIGVGAGLIQDVIKGGMSRLWSAWQPDVEESVGAILEDGALAAAADARIGGGASGSVSTLATRRFIPGGAGWGHPVPPVILVQISKKRDGDPAADLLVAFVNTGRQYVVLKPWAWQTLLMFVHSLTSGQSGAGLDIAKAGCALSLMPSGVRPVSGHSPEGTVDWVSYKSRNGVVEISRVQGTNSSVTGVITATAISDADGQPLRMSFGLPA